MRAIFEGGFDILYLVGVIILGIDMIYKSENKTRKLFGIMALVLGIGDAFHLVPRIYSLFTIGFEANAKALGIGKFITSITMTIFYIILYYIWRIYYQVENREKLTMSIWGLAILRIILSLLPQNQWLLYNPPKFFSILRNIPFAIMGILIIIAFYKESKKTKDKVFQYMPLAITLSFGFYIPVVLFGDINELIGLLMIPKTLAYVWIVYMGYQLPLKEENETLLLDK